MITDIYTKKYFFLLKTNEKRNVTKVWGVLRTISSRLSHIMKKILRKNALIM